jgi:hypothetical protein
MRSIGVGLAVALVVGVLAPATVMSASKKAAEIPAAARKQGMAEAPAIVQAGGLGCQVTDARFVGKAKDVSFYEVDCSQGLGFVVQSGKEGPPVFFSCIEANTPPSPGKDPAAPCMLPGNADPKADLAPYLAAAKVQCTPTQARGIGQSKTNAYLEVACQEGPGYVLVTSAPSDATKPGLRRRRGQHQVHPDRQGGPPGGRRPLRRGGEQRLPGQGPALYRRDQGRRELFRNLLQRRQGLHLQGGGRRARPELGLRQGVEHPGRLHAHRRP